MEDILGETHHLSGSLKEDQARLMVSLKKFVDTNALVTSSFWKDSGDYLQQEYLLEEFK